MTDACVLCTLGYEPVGHTCGWRGHLFDEAHHVQIAYHCPVTWAQLPSAVVLIPGHLPQVVPFLEEQDNARG